MSEANKQFEKLLGGMSRADLDTLAAETEIADPEKYSNRAQVIEAIIDQADPELLAAFMAERFPGDEEKPKAEEKGYEPVTFWLGNPELNIRLYKNGFERVKFVNGRFTTRTAEQEELIRKHLKGVAFEEDTDRAYGPHPGSGYAPKSRDAYEAHQDLFPVNQR